MARDQDTVRVRRPYHGREQAAPPSSSSDSSTSSSEPPATPGRAIGPYRLMQELGRGGQGVVYLAMDMRLRRRVALKVLTQSGDTTQQLMQRFRREAELASKLDHPGICGVLDAGVADGTAFIAMRYVPGETLARRLQELNHAEVARICKNSGSMDSEEASRSTLGGGLKSRVRKALVLMESVARAVHAAHEIGIIHRDMKPGNIMVTPDGRPVVLDFGFARDLSDGAVTLSDGGELVGTPAYMAPEQIRTDGSPIDCRSDVYGLGVTLYECVTLRRPFEATGRETLYHAILNKAPQDPRKFAHGLPQDLKVVLDTALDKDPARRYQTAAAFADDLRAILDMRPISARPQSCWTRLYCWARREPAKAALIALLVLGIPAAAVMAGWMLARFPELWASEHAVNLERLLESGYLELGEGSSEKAVRHFEEASLADPTSTEAVAGLAMAELGQNRATLALLVLNERGSKVAEPSALERVRIEVLEALGRTAQANALAEKLGPPRDAISHFLLGERALRRGHNGEVEQFTKALAHYTSAILLEPRARGVFHFQRAHAATHARDDAARRESADALRMIFPKSAMAWFWIGFALREVEPEAAIDAYKKATELAPNQALSHSNLAECLTACGRYEESNAVAERALELVPTDAGTVEILGTNALRQRDLARAEREFRRSLELDSHSITAISGLSMVLEMQGRPEEGLRILRSFVDHHPRSATGWSALGQSLAGLGRNAEAREAFSKAASIAQRNDRIRLDLAWICHQLGDHQAAAKEARLAVEISPRSPRSLYALGNYELACGNLDAAEEAFKRSIDFDSSLGEVWNNLAIVAEHREQDDLMIERLKKAIEVSPSLRQPHENLVRGLRRLVRFEELRAELVRWADLHPQDGANYLELAQVLRRFDRLSDERNRPELVRVANRAATLLPSSAEAQLVWAIVLRLEEREAEARAVAERARSLNANESLVQQIDAFLSN